MPAHIRHTEQRQAILRVVKFSDRPLRPSQVYDLVHAHSRAISRATVYRALRWLAERGEIYQVEDEHGDRCFAGHAYHRITAACQRCGRVWHRTEPSLQAAIRRQGPAVPMIFFSAITVGGLCQDCLTKIAHLKAQS